MEIYDQAIQKVRGTEFPQTEGITYLDHAGTTLYAKSQLVAHLNDLTSNLYGNPHSHNPSSQLTADTIDYVRELVLHHFNTTISQYDVIFTSSCTGALKLLSESFPWKPNVHSDLCLQAKNVATQCPPGSSCADFVCCAGTSRQEVLYFSECDEYHLDDGEGRGREGGGGVGGRRGEREREEGGRGGRGGGGEERGGGEKEEREGRGRQESGGEKGGREDRGGGFDDGKTGGSVFCYLEDNHTSVVGMREVAAKHGATIVCTTEQYIVDSVQPAAQPIAVPVSVINSHHTALSGREALSSTSNAEQQQLSIQQVDVSSHCAHLSGAPFHLFAYPAQSNFSGRKYPLSWTKDVPSGRVCVTGLQHNICGTWLVLLDAASHVSTGPLDLSEHPAHFVALSFYKMFGFPTGLGALLVRTDCAQLLCKEYYGGGTVMATISRERFYIPRPQLHDRFEDGTLPFLDIVALRHGFSALQRLARSMEHMSSHTFSLARHVHHSMLGMRHGNGRPVCVLYCDTDYEDPNSQGAIVNFNLLRADGSFVGYSEVDKLACVHDIHLRTGCFCNTGACMRHLGLSTERMKKNIEAGHVCGDSIDLVDGYPTGSVRVSFGYMSTFEDAQRFLNFIEQCFVDNRPQIAEENLASAGSKISPSTTVGTCEALQVSTTGSHSNQRIGFPATERDLAAVRNSESVRETQDLAAVRNSESVRETQDLAAVRNSESVRETQDLVNHRVSCYPSLRNGTEEQSRLHSYDGRLVVGEQLGVQEELQSSQNDFMSNGGTSADVRGGSDVGLRVGEVLQVLLEGKQGSGQVEGPAVTVEKIALYPVKSCRVFEVSSWPVGGQGFLYDREWMVLSEHCSVLSQKQEPRLCFIQPSLDLSTHTMTLTAKGWPPLVVPLTFSEKAADYHSSAICQTRVCGDKVQGLDCGEGAAQWVSGVLGRRCRLVRRSPSSQRRAKELPATGGPAIPISLANKAQYLLISRASAEDLRRTVAQQQQDTQLSLEDLLGRFRPNLVVSGSQPYAEEEWVELRSQGHTFKVTGPCSRCQMVCVDQQTAQRTAEPLKTLVAQRGNKVHFGIYLAAMQDMYH